MIPKRLLSVENEHPEACTFCGYFVLIGETGSPTTGRKNIYGDAKHDSKKREKEFGGFKLTKNSHIFLFSLDIGFCKMTRLVPPAVIRRFIEITTNGIDHFKLSVNIIT